MDKSTILEMRKITKEFNTVKVLEDVDFEVKRGEVHALVGANGAGKSTLMKILNGIYAINKGTIFFNGEKIAFANPRDAFNKGISMIHQELDLVTNLDVSENIYLGREIRNMLIINRKKMRTQTQEVLDSLHFDINAQDEVGKLSPAKQQLVLVARTVSLRSNLILMDEPTSSLSVTETDALFEVIHRLKESGISIIYISHYLEEIFKIADRVTVLRNGRKVITSPVSECTQDQVVEWMVGYKMNRNTRTNRDFSDSKEILRVEGLTQKRGKVSQASFAVKKGEVIGLAGVVGSGRTELLKMVFGAEKKIAGKITLGGKNVDISNPMKAVKLHIGFVPEDRKTEGLILRRTISDNISLSELKKRSHYGILDFHSIRDFTRRIIESLHIRCTSATQEVSYISGGNQQKVVIGKWLSGEFKILIFDQPTRGVDVGAKEEIYQIIRELSDQGVSILIATDEIEELLNLCNKILVLKKGTIVYEFDNDRLTLTKADVLAKMVS
jgi:ABC-type sugar transport system ATPase subunit